jgi:hypothetical protein
LLPIDEYLPHREYVPEERPPDDKEALPQIDLSRLSPHEAVALQRYAREENRDLVEPIDSALTRIAIENPELAAEIFTALADSPLGEDRHDLAAYHLREFTAAIPDVGMVLYDRLLRDSSAGVRQAAHFELSVAIGDASHDKSTDDDFRRLDSIDEQKLREYIGLTPEQARSLLASYYAAEIGKNIYNPGLEAFKKLQGGS